MKAIKLNEKSGLGRIKTYPPLACPPSPLSNTQGNYSQKYSGELSPSFPFLDTPAFLVSTGLEHQACTSLRLVNPLGALIRRGN